MGVLKYRQRAESWASRPAAKRQGLAEPTPCRNEPARSKMREIGCRRGRNAGHGKPRVQTGGNGTVDGARDRKMPAQPLRPTILPEKRQCRRMRPEGNHAA